MHGCRCGLCRPMHNCVPSPMSAGYAIVQGAALSPAIRWQPAACPFPLALQAAGASLAQDVVLQEPQALAKRLADLSSADGGATSGP